MSKMVSARVPEGVYELASKTLESLHSSTSDLINSAFEYVIKEQKLPESPIRSEADRRRSLTLEQADRLRNFFAACSLTIAPRNASDKDIEEDKKLIQEAKARKYEGLAI